MTDGRPNDALDQLSDDALIAAGAELEADLTLLTAALEAVAGPAALEWPKLRVAGIKLDVNASLALAGIAGAPVTVGISLLLTAVGLTMIAWDAVDFARNLASYQAQRRQLRHIQAEVTELEASLALHVAEIERRTRN